MAPTNAESEAPEHDNSVREQVALWFVRGLIRMHVPMELACFWAAGIFPKRRPKTGRRVRLDRGQQSPRGVERPPVITTRQVTPPPPTVGCCARCHSQGSHLC